MEELNLEGKMGAVNAEAMQAERAAHVEAALKVGGRFV